MVKAKQKYQLGDRLRALKLMAEYAIRDQEALIDAMTPTFGKPDETDPTVIHARMCIADFRLIAKSAR